MVACQPAPVRQMAPTVCRARIGHNQGMTTMSTRIATLLDRLPGIHHARQALLYGGGTLTPSAAPLDSWIERSWRRCLANGHQPAHTPVFDTVATSVLRRTLEANHALIITGQHTCENVPRDVTVNFKNTLDLGLGLIWSGNVAVAAIAVVLLTRLQRQ